MSEVKWLCRVTVWPEQGLCHPVPSVSAEQMQAFTGGTDISSLCLPTGALYQQVCSRRVMGKCLALRKMCCEKRLLL